MKFHLVKAPFYNFSVKGAETHMIAIVDYGVGNLFSLHSSLKALNITSKVTGNAQEIKQADQVILPGVGAFKDAMLKLKQANLIETMQELAILNKPVLGICLGMQMLFDSSYEFGHYQGLGLIKGNVISLKQALEKEQYGYKVPHMGWNTLQINKPDCPILKYTKNNEYMYYVHSYYAVDCKENTAAYSQYGVDITGVVSHNNVFGTQFHPEKSGPKGLDILRAFSEV